MTLLLLSVLLVLPTLHIRTNCSQSRLFCLPLLFVFLLLDARTQLAGTFSFARLKELFIQVRIRLYTITRTMFIMTGRRVPRGPQTDGTAFVHEKM